MSIETAQIGQKLAKIWVNHVDTIFSDENWFYLKNSVFTFLLIYVGQLVTFITHWKAEALMIPVQYTTGQWCQEMG